MSQHPEDIAPPVLCASRTGSTRDQADGGRDRQPRDAGALRRWSIGATAEELAISGLDLIGGQVTVTLNRSTNSAWAVDRGDGRNELRDARAKPRWPPSWATIRVVSAKSSALSILPANCLAPCHTHIALALRRSCSRTRPRACSRRRERKQWQGDPAFAHKHPGARLIGVAWCLGIIAWSLLFCAARRSRAPRLTTPPRSPSSCDRP